MAWAWHGIAKQRCRKAMQYHPSDRLGGAAVDPTNAWAPAVRFLGILALIISRLGISSLLVSDPHRLQQKPCDRAKAESHSLDAYLPVRSPISCFQ
jgi:hypothetical protein